MAPAAVPEADFGLASEGSFGRHPWLPWIGGGRELIVLMDRDGGFELAGADLTAETNCRSRLVSSVADALAFAQSVGFPSHAIVVIGVHNGEPDVSKGAYKDLMTTEEIENSVRVVLEQHGTAHVESDMRAHVNPTRMQAIERTTLDLARRALSGCPRYERPRFDWKSSAAQAAAFEKNVSRPPDRPWRYRLSVCALMHRTTCAAAHCGEQR